MDINDDDRARLSKRLGEVLGDDHARTLMRHLPDGEIAKLATRDDLQALRNELMGEIAKCATKDDLRQFATKDDLTQFATKDDLTQFATKDDLTQFATKDDLTQFATKDDLTRFATLDEHRHLERRMERVEDKVDDLAKDVREALVTGDRLRAEWRKDLQATLTRQTVVQLAALVSIVIAAFAYASGLTP